MFGLFDKRVYYHITLGCLGVAATLSAAFDFRYLAHAKNKASGTLERHATVTYSEMIEHSFYQVLNLVQIIALYALDSRWLGAKQRYSSGLSSLVLSSPMFWSRAGVLLVATLPWLVRKQFPVNRFSDNYKDIPLDKYSTELLMYR
jgi:hypothetical protein